jgi:broad specificity phosphatase PhoE/8-oxo-dGTP pyrophosphatase MutT (NUDIX family)
VTPASHVLVRHGWPKIRRDQPAPTWPLHPEARVDVEALAARLPDAGLVLTSDEPKAAATAAIICDVAGGELRPDPRLREVARPARWDERYEATAARYLTGEEVFGWEPRDEVVARVRDALGGAPLGTVAVGHGLSLTLYTAALHDLDPVGFWRDLAFPDAWLAGTGHPRKLVSGTGDGRHFRPSGRVIVLDDAGRVLLFPARNPDYDSGWVWVTPGGAARPLEDHAAAALRELREEVGLGLDRDQLGAPVATSSGPFTWRGRDYWGEDVFFAVRAVGLEVDTSGFTELERHVIGDHRWWTPEELEETGEVVYPLGLGSLVRRLAAGERPDPPVPLPWE